MNQTQQMFKQPVFTFTRILGTDKIKVQAEFNVINSPEVKQIIKGNGAHFDRLEKYWHIPHSNLNNLIFQITQLLPNVVIRDLQYEQILRKFHFSLSEDSDGRVIIEAQFELFTEIVKKIIKDHEGTYVKQSKCWFVPISFYKSFLIQLLQAYPDMIIHESIGLQNELISFTTNQIDNVISCYSIKTELNQKLYQYQRDCVAQGIKFKGKILIADEMGVGKTIEALALASVYQHCWPLLIICPSHLKLQWQSQVKYWLKLPSNQIQIIMSSSDQLHNVKITIISYKLCVNLKQILTEQQYKICIADESQFLKNYKSKTTNACKTILNSSFHNIFLSGTPIMSRPCELFTQLNLINRFQYSNFLQFGKRYCDPKPNDFTNGGYDYSGSSNAQELYERLTKTIMIRRMKSEVQDQLPELKRYKILLSISNKPMDSGNALQSFQASGIVKLKLIKEYLQTLFDNEIKFLFFGHHKEFLDEIEIFCNQKNIKSIRIDGETGLNKRVQNIKIFQENSNVKIAILSLTAVSTGINLTAAAIIVFGEIYWTPAVMVQAESRAHRIGQEKNVECYYLIGKGSYDEKIYNMIELKYNTISNCLNGLDEDFEAQIVSTTNNEQMNQEFDYWFENLQESDVEDQSQLNQTDSSQLSDEQNEDEKKVQGIQKRIRKQEHRQQ